MNNYFFKAIAAVSSIMLNMAGCQAQTFAPQAWGDWQTYGEQKGCGMYVNPVLPGDFSDIDCIEHDGYYYAISSTFQFEPGMAILRSADMVNWSVYSHAVPDVSQISEAMTSHVMDRYARGIWAGAIRWRNGRFYVYFGCPDEGMFMTTAPKIDGPWTPLHKMNIGGGWDDCCPLFDDDGQNYFVATHFADGYKTYVFRLSADGKTVDRESAVLINEGYGREANKLYKFNGKYYHLYSEDKDGGRYLMMQRADNPMGPYTEKRRLSHTQREWHEPNQGGYLQDKDGNWFFLTHHGSGDWGGRQVSLLPVTWIDGWPVIGNPDDDGIGRMVLNCRKPQTVRRDNGSLASSRRYVGFGLPDWEWNYHPVKERYVRTKKSLALHASVPLRENDLLKASNTLTMRSWQTPHNVATVCLDFSSAADGQRCGMCHFSASWSEFGVKQVGSSSVLYYRDNKGREVNVQADLNKMMKKKVYLRSSWDLSGLCHYSWSLDGCKWTDAGVTYQMEWGNYRGDRIGLYTYNNICSEGDAIFTKFIYESSDEAAVVNVFDK